VEINSDFIGNHVTMDLGEDVLLVIQPGQSHKIKDDVRSNYEKK